MRLFFFLNEMYHPIQNGISLAQTPNSTRQVAFIVKPLRVYIALDKGASRWHGVFGELYFSMEANVPEAAAWLNSIISIDPRAM